MRDAFLWVVLFYLDELFYKQQGAVNRDHLELAELMNRMHPPLSPTKFFSNDVFFETTAPTSSSSSSSSSKNEKQTDKTHFAEREPIIDLKSAVKVAGTKFYILRREAALLELAIIQWAMSRLVERGFEPLTVPDLVYRSMVDGAGFAPREAAVDSEGEGKEHHTLYRLRDSPLVLAGTSELALAVDVSAVWIISGHPNWVSLCFLCVGCAAR